VVLILKVNKDFLGHELFGKSESLAEGKAGTKDLELASVPRRSKSESPLNEDFHKQFILRPRRTKDPILLSSRRKSGNWDTQNPYSPNFNL